MTGGISMFAAVVYLFFFTTTLTDGLQIKTGVPSVQCKDLKAEHALNPCIMIANDFHVSSLVSKINITAENKLFVFRKVIVKIFEGLLLTKDYELNAKNFNNLCKSFNMIYQCMIKTMDACIRTLHRTIFLSETRSLQNQFLMTLQGERASCDFKSGYISNSFASRLDKTSIKGCLNAMSMELKKEMIKTIREIGNTLMYKTVYLSDVGKAAKEARALCRKLDDVMLIFKLASRCNSGQCNSTSTGLFGNTLIRLLSTPGVCGCGKSVREVESNAKIGKTFGKGRETIFFIGLSHIKNPKISNEFETCIMDSGDVTLIYSEKLIIRATMVKRKNFAGKEFSYMTKIYIQMFGSSNNCGRIGDAPVKVIVFGQGINSPLKDTKTKVGEKSIFVLKLPTKGSGNDERFLIVDQCGAVAMIIRSYEIPTLGKVLYLTMRLSETVELAGALFSGCVKQVSVPDVSYNIDRRNERAATSPFMIVGSYDSRTARNEMMLSIAEAIAEDADSLEKTDSVTLGESEREVALMASSAAELVAAATSIVVAMATLVLNR